MPATPWKIDRTACRRILLTTALGAVSGFQFWRLAVGFARAIPWYGLAWILLSFALLGISIGVAAPFARWWKRGLVMGLACSIPSAVGSLLLGLRVPYAAAPIVGGVAAGVLIAWLADTAIPWFRPPEVSEPSEFIRQGPIRQRLAEAKVRLEELEAERKLRRDWDYGKAVEERIIWGELLDLELQDIDDQIRRIRHTAGSEPRYRPRS